MNIKKSFKKLFKKGHEESNRRIVNLYKTDHHRTALICYITSPFLEQNNFVHQNYVTSHIVAESFSTLGYNVDVVDYSNLNTPIDYESYDVIFGIGDNFERSFHSTKRSILRIHLITGAHQDLHNEMSLKSVKDFYKLSGLWLTNEANVLPESCYYSMFNADAAIILAQGFIFNDCRRRFENKLYSLNNNILGIFSSFADKTKRTSNFLFLSGGRQITKGLPLLLEVARARKDLNFYVVVPHINKALESYYLDVIESDNVLLFKGITMDSVEMRTIIETCSYVVAPSYIDGLPGGTIEPMSAGLIPIVSKYCGFDDEPFIFEIEELSVDGLNATINSVMDLDDLTYFEFSDATKKYADQNFSKSNVKQQLMSILKVELPH